MEYTKWIQERLNNHGYGFLEIDGIFGEHTEEALREFQRDKNLVVDGICGVNTHNGLMDLKEENEALFYFSEDEFKCECGCGLDLNPVLKEKLDLARGMFGSPFIVTSGARCFDQNRADGGIPDSLHLSGNASDISSPGINRDMIEALAEVGHRVGLGVGKYYGSNFVHFQIEPWDFVGD